MEEFKKFLEEYQKTSDKIEKILEKSEQNRAVVSTIELKLDLIKDEWQKISKIIYGDGLIDSLPSRLKFLESQVLELAESLEQIEMEHKRTTEAEKGRNQKIIVALIGGLFTIISSVLAWVFEAFKKN